jgi:hypothetical protein
MNKLLTYTEFTKTWNLVDKIKFHYDVDLGLFKGNLSETISEIKNDAKSLTEFEQEFKLNLQEREYIK